MDLDEARRFWQIASSFPSTKEDVYPEHATAQEFDEIHGKHVLEYGCGGGSDTLSFLRRGNYTYYADIVEANLRTTRQRVLAAGFGDKAQLLFLKASAPLPLRDTTMDVISSHGVLHHIVDPKPVLDEFRRVIKPDGTLYVMLYTEMLERRFYGEISKLQSQGMSYGRAFGACTDGAGCPYARSYTEDQGRAFLAAAGFDVVKTTLYNHGDFRTYKAKVSREIPDSP